MNTNSSAEFQLEPLEYPAGSAPAARSVLKQEVAERIAAHRSRRQTQGSALSIAAAAPKAVRRRSISIAAAVAERYAQSQSYRDFLAAEAERAIDEANAAAQVAARSAQAIAAAQQQLLAELEHWNDPPIEDVGLVKSARPVQDRATSALSGKSATTVLKSSELTVRLYEDVGARRNHAGAFHRSDDSMRPAPNPVDPEENFALDDEIAFRQAPIFEESAPPTPIPANLIEFPRQLVAPRKSRPRIAEGPLRDEADAVPATVQLRIFEVEATQICTEPIPEAQQAVPVWSSIRLDAAPVAELKIDEATSLAPLLQTPPMQVASLGLRLMAGAVDLCLLGATFLAAVTAFASLATALPGAPVDAIAALGTFVALFMVYQLLFFTLSDATPGMRYARIGLCTFDDENPTRSEMRRRTWAVLLAAFPLGLGFLWMWADGEGLGWHDRLSRMYQRSY